MDLSQQITSKFGGGNRYEEYDEDSLIYIHHMLMKEYGWIPLEEFRNLPIPTIQNLMNCIKEDKEREKKEAEKIKNKRR